MIHLLQTHYQAPRVILQHILHGEVVRDLTTTNEIADLVITTPGLILSEARSGKTVDVIPVMCKLPDR